MPMDPSRYHPDWPWMSRQIRAQAGWRCEWCGVPNGAQVPRETGRVTTIVLTVHHQCQCDKRLCWDPSHLVALCQACHLRADMDKHVARAAETRRRKRMERGQIEMPGVQA